MNWKVYLFVISLCSILLGAPLSSALSANVTNNNLRSSYTPLEVLSGGMNLSLKDVPSSSLLESSLGGSIGIKDFLDNASASYSCSPADCAPGYAGSSSENKKTLSLKQSETKILGILFEGVLKEEGVLDFKFNVQSNAPASCVNPLTIDILDDDDPQYAANTSANDFSCYATTGCFSQKEGEVRIDDKEYCNKLSLNPAPAYKLGAFVKKSGTTTLLKMRLKKVLENNQSEELEGAECVLPDPNVEGEVSCTINYAIAERGDYYSCITAVTASNYTLPYEEKAPLCGYYDFLEDNYTVDYHIFARASRYLFQDFSFYQDTQNVNALPLLSYISQYLETRYHRDCRKGCMVPLVFISGTQQDITLSDLYVEYSTQVGPKTATLFWDVEKKDPFISMDHHMLDLAAAGFKAPAGYGNYTLGLAVAGTPFFTKKIEVKKVPLVSAVTPQTAPQSTTTKFKVTARSPENKSLSRYLWNFGDNTTAETAAPEVEHSYSKIGIYTLSVSVIDIAGNEGAGSFQIIVGSARDAVNQTIKSLRAQINSLNANLSLFWYRKSLEEKIKISDAEKALQEAQKLLLIAKTDDDYGAIARKLESISLPHFLQASSTINIPFVFDINKINFDYLKELGAGLVDLESEEKYRNAIWSWFSEQEKQKEYTTLTAYNRVAQILGAAFKLEIQGSEDLFLIVNKPLEQIQFLEDYSPVNLGGSVGIVLKSGKSVTFFIKGKIIPEEVVMYLSPKLEDLEVGLAPEPCNYNARCEKDLGETTKNCKADCPPRGKTFFFIFLLLIIAFIGYTFIQEWYRKRYESHLFKNKTDVYNLLNFIGNGLKQGLSREDIAKKLKSSGWNSEQISYVFKKVDGKRVGLPGFNILEILERRRNKKRFNNLQTMRMTRTPPGVQRPLR